MFEIALRKIRCKIKDSFAADSDEPYVIVYAADLGNVTPLPQGKAKTTLYGPWVGDQSMDGGDVRVLSNPPVCWGPNHAAHDIEAPQDALVLVGLMESDHDAASCEGLRAGVQSGMFAAFSNYDVAAMDRDALVEALRQDLQGQLEVFRIVTGPPENDERLGAVQVLKITAQHLEDAATGVVNLPVVRFTNDDADFDYELTFQIGSGEGSVSQGLGSDPDAVDAGVDKNRPAIVGDSSAGQLDIVTVPKGSHKAVRVSSSNGGGAWVADWNSHQIGQGLFTSGVAAAVSGNGKRLQVFGRGNDHKIWRAFSPDGGAQWTVAWLPIGAGVFTSAPAAAVSADGKQVHVFGRGYDNRIWRAFSPDGGSQWTVAWLPIGHGVFTSAPAAAVSADGKRLHVFGRGNDKRIWRAFSADGGAGWQVAWVPIGEGLFTSEPAAAISADGKQLHVFGRGNDKRIWRALSLDGGASWSVAWAPIGNAAFSSGPGATISADGKEVVVVARGVHPPPPPPGTFGDPEEPRVWRTRSDNGGTRWSLAWAPVQPSWINRPAPQ